MKRPGHSPERNEPNTLSARQDLAQLLGPHAHHHAGAKLDALVVGHEHGQSLERDVDLLLVGILHTGVVTMQRMPVPVRGSVITCMPNDDTPSDARARRATPS